MASRLLVQICLLALLSGCAYNNPQNIEVADSKVGGTGGLQYNHEKLGSSKHMLSVTAAPGLMETEGSIEQRIHIFANRFASQSCQHGFDFIHDPNFDQRISAGFMKRSRTYVFECRA